MYGVKSDFAKAASYTIPTKTNLNTYEFIKDTDGSIKQFEGPFGTRGMLQQKGTVTDGDRFYVMALADIDDNTYTWYKNAVGKMSTYTSTAFGSGKTNTEKMIARGNAGGTDANDKTNSNYGALSDTDVWKVIQTVTANNGTGNSSSSSSSSSSGSGGGTTISYEPTKKEYKFSADPYLKVDGAETSYKIDKTNEVVTTPTSLVSKGWFVPSRDEWKAFGAFFKVGGEGSKQGFDGNTHTYTNYYDYKTVYKLSNWCWSSSQNNTSTAWGTYFSGGRMNSTNVNTTSYVRLVATF